MFIIETRDAKRMRKYAILMGVVFLIFGIGVIGALGALLTMHIYTMPHERRRQQSRSAPWAPTGLEKRDGGCGGHVLRGCTGTASSARQVRIVGLPRRGRNAVFLEG